MFCHLYKLAILLNQSLIRYFFTHLYLLLNSSGITTVVMRYNHVIQPFFIDLKILCVIILIVAGIWYQCMSACFFLICFQNLLHQSLEVYLTGFLFFYFYRYMTIYYVIFQDLIRILLNIFICSFFSNTKVWYAFNFSLWVILSSIKYLSGNVLISSSNGGECLPP